MIYWGQKPGTKWTRSLTKMIGIIVNVAGVSLWIFVLYSNSKDTYNFMNMSPFAKYFVLSNGASFMWICLFLWKSLWTNQVDLMIKKVNIESTVASAGLKIKLIIIADMLLSVCLCVSYLFAIFYASRGVGLIVSTVLKDGIVHQAIEILYSVCITYSLVFTSVFVMFFSTIFIVCKLQLQGIERDIELGISNGSIYEDMTVFQTVVERFSEVSSVCAEIDSLFCVLFGLSLAFLINVFISGVYVLFFLSGTLPVVQIFFGYVAWAVGLFLLLTVPAASVHSEVCALTIKLL